MEQETRRPMIAGNWKMNGLSDSLGDLAAGVLADVRGLPWAEDFDWAVFPSFVYLLEACEWFDGSVIRVGGQDLSTDVSGPYTGQVSGDQLLDVGCTCVLVGHSERRHGLSESLADIANKTRMALQFGLTPILCIGETLAEREAGDTFTILEKQLTSVLAMPEVLAALSECVIAYEPVWAIGTGLTAEPNEVAAVHQHLRCFLSSFDSSAAAEIRLLYGGSVSPDNAASLFAVEGVDGFLIGGASLRADTFGEIARQCFNLL